MSALNNYLLKLIDNLQADNDVLRNNLKERNTENISLRLELEQSQKSIKQLRVENSQLKAKTDGKKVCQITSRASIIKRYNEQLAKHKKSSD